MHVGHTNERCPQTLDFLSWSWYVAQTDRPRTHSVPKAGLQFPTLLPPALKSRAYQHAVTSSSSTKQSSEVNPIAETLSFVTGQLAFKRPGHPEEPGRVLVASPGCVLTSAATFPCAPGCTSFYFPARSNFLLQGIVLRSTICGWRINYCTELTEGFPFTQGGTLS